MKGIPHKNSDGLEYTEYTIPKKGGKGRRIFAPSPELLKVQRGSLPGLESELFRLENKFQTEDILQGFIKNRNPVTAATQHIGYDLTVMMDISSFFDSVDTSLVLDTGVKVSSDYLIPDCFHYPKEGKGFTAQGFATSPVLANIAITPIIKEIKEYLEVKFKGRYAFTMYADDIQISINSTNFIQETNNIIDVVTFLIEDAGFEMNNNKTRIRHAKFGYRRILGINVGHDKLYASRKTMRKLRCARHQKNWPSVGGLTTWSRCLLPKALRPKVDISLQEFTKMVTKGEIPRMVEAHAEMLLTRSTTFNNNGTVDYASMYNPTIVGLYK